MKAYKYDKDTLEYKGEIELQKCPIDNETYLEPPFITKTPPPPVRELYAIYYNPILDNWEEREDPRQGTWYNKENGQEEFASEIENLENYTRVKPTIVNPTWEDGRWVVKLEEIRSTVKYLLTVQMKAELDEPVEVDGYNYLCKDDTFNALNRLLSSSSDTVIFRTADNDYAKLTKKDIEKIIKSLIDKEQEILNKFWKFKDELLEIKTFEDLKEFIRCNVESIHYDDATIKILDSEGEQ